MSLCSMYLGHSLRRPSFAIIDRVVTRGRRGRPLLRNPVTDGTGGYRFEASYRRHFWGSKGLKPPGVMAMFGTRSRRST
jgi:hypothetical protein